MISLFFFVILLLAQNIGGQKDGLYCDLQIDVGLVNPTCKRSSQK